MDRSIMQFALAAVLILTSAGARPTADGPDYYRVTGVSPGSSLNLRAGPGIAERRIGSLPAESDGLRNLGCEGGMTFEDYVAASPAEREAASKTRWCRIEYRGQTGWVAGWYLAEGSAPTEMN